MSEQRGSKLNRLADRYVGLLILSCLSLLLGLKRIVWPAKVQDDETCLLVCFGAIGDLIILTNAVQHQLAGKRVYLACSQLNFGAAKLYESFYAGTEPVSLKDLLAVHRIAKQFGIRKIFDSTQWANIGPIQVGIAELLGCEVSSVGFLTKNYVRNKIYGEAVLHSDHIHELGNFANLIAGYNKITSNVQLDTVVPSLYSHHPCRKTGKALLHMWPSGNRSYLKAWPETYWMDLIQNLIERGYEIYLSGSMADKEKSEEFVRRMGDDRVVNLAGFYSLLELRDFIKNHVEFLISVNTGILHLGASVGAPVIGLHGPTDPIRWGPLGKHAIPLLPESGRFAYLNYGFEYPDEDKEAYALDRLSVLKVIDAVDTLLRDL